MLDQLGQARGALRQAIGAGVAAQQQLALHPRAGRRVRRTRGRAGARSDRCAGRRKPTRRRARAPVARARLRPRARASRPRVAVRRRRRAGRARRRGAPRCRRRAPASRRRPRARPSGAGRLVRTRWPRFTHRRLRRSAARRARPPQRRRRTRRNALVASADCPAQTWSARSLPPPAAVRTRLDGVGQRRLQHEVVALQLGNGDAGETQARRRVDIDHRIASCASAAPRSSCSGTRRGR